jgi:hypothetical protein
MQSRAATWIGSMPCLDAAPNQPEAAGGRQRQKSRLRTFETSQADGKDERYHRTAGMLGRP